MSLVPTSRFGGEPCLSFASLAGCSARVLSDRATRGHTPRAPRAWDCVPRYPLRSMQDAADPAGSSPVSWNLPSASSGFARRSLVPTSRFEGGPCLSFASLAGCSARVLSDRATRGHTPRAPRAWDCVPRYLLRSMRDAVDPARSSGLIGGARRLSRRQEAEHPRLTSAISVRCGFRRACWGRRKARGTGLRGSPCRRSRGWWG